MTHTHTPVQALYESDTEEDLLGGDLDPFGNGEECRPLDKDGFIVPSDVENNDCEYETIDSEHESDTHTSDMESETHTERDSDVIENNEESDETSNWYVQRIRKRSPGWQHRCSI
jgi:hypothetical protein